MLLLFMILIVYIILEPLLWTLHNVYTSLLHMSCGIFWRNKGFKREKKNREKNYIVFIDATYLCFKVIDNKRLNLNSKLHFIVS